MSQEPGKRSVSLPQDTQYCTVCASAKAAALSLDRVLTSEYMNSKPPAQPQRSREGPHAGQPGALAPLTLRTEHGINWFCFLS